MEILSDPTPDMLAMPRFDDGAIDMQELLRRLAEQVVNAVMDAEADQLCGGGSNSRNGYRERSLATCVGTLTLRIPKLRTGSFFPDDVIERYQRADRALVAAVALEAPAHQQRAGEDQPRDKAQVARRAGVPVNGLVGAARGRGHVRAGRDMARVQVLLGGEDERALRRGPHARDRRPRRLGAA